MRKLLLLAVIGIVLYLGYSYYSQGDTLTQLQPHTTTSERVQRTAPRINQLDPAQYYPYQDFGTWSPSTCSSAAMTSVINSYGHNYKLGDILDREYKLHEITSDLGLVEPDGIAKTVAFFGFSARYLSQSTLPEGLNQVLTIANGGHPIIVSFPPATFQNGHIFVVDGSTTLLYHKKMQRQLTDGSTQIYYQDILERHLVITDSSSMQWRFMPEENFLNYWRGFAVEVYPKGTQP